MDTPVASLPVAQLAAELAARLAATPADAAPGSIADLSLRHLAKAVGTTQSALRLIEDGRRADACILARAVFEQLFTYLWIVADPDRAPIRASMVTLKQEWANAKYLENLAANAAPADQPTILAEAARYRDVAEGLLADLAERLGTTPKKVRDEATMRASLKAIEVALGPAYSLPYAYYSGFVHADGVALSAYVVDGRYDPRSGPLQGFPIEEDLHRALSRLSEEVLSRVSG